MTVRAVGVIERITCDNAECMAYVDELVRIGDGPEFVDPDRLAQVRAKAATEGWSAAGGTDRCPAHTLGT